MGNMGSAHPLVEVNVSFKFEGNPSISKGVIERTRIGRRTDRRTDRPTRQSESSIAPPTFSGGGIIIMSKERSNVHIQQRSRMLLKSFIGVITAFKFQDTQPGKIIYIGNSTTCSMYSNKCRLGQLCHNT